jgi:hypothetical protein
MSIRRIGGGSPFVSLPPSIQRERRIDPVKGYVRTDGKEVLEGDEVGETELPLDPDEQKRERESRELRAQLLTDAYEQQAKEELLDLKGGEDLEASEADLPEGAGAPGLSVGDLLRSSSFAAATRAQRRVALESPTGDGPVFDEGPFSGARAEEEPEYSDPGSEGFFASLDDVAHLESDNTPDFDPALDGFLASDADLPFSDEPEEMERAAAPMARPSLEAEHVSTQALLADSEGDVPVREEGASLVDEDSSTQALLADSDGDVPVPEPMDSFEPAPAAVPVPAARVSEHPVADEFAELASAAAEAVAAEAAAAEAVAVEAPALASVGLPFDEAEASVTPASQPPQDWGTAAESPPASSSVGLPFDET